MATVCLGRRVEGQPFPVAVAVVKLDRNGVAQVRVFGLNTVPDIFGGDDISVDGVRPHDGPAFLAALERRFPRHQGPGALEAW